MSLDRRSVGIDGAYVYIPRLYLSLSELATRRSVPKEKYLEGLDLRRMAVLHPLEDPVTMAAMAGRRLLEHWKVPVEEIGMVVVGTESGVDESKPISAYLHRLLSLPSTVRVFDIKHACYSGTAALRMAAEWVASPAARGRKALVVTTDVAYYDLHSPAEPTQGAGAVALLVSTNPRVAELHFEHEAVYTEEVTDFWRPPYSLTAMVSGHYSVECYLTGLRAAYRLFRERSSLTLDSFSGFAFHTPFPKMAKKAFSLLWRMEKKREKGLEDAFASRVEPGLLLARELGNIYSSSLMGAFLSLLSSQTVRAGDTVALFSYGSGSTSEFFSVTVRSVPEPGMMGFDHLASRSEISYEEYLMLRSVYERKTQNGSFDDSWLTDARHFEFVYLGIRDNQRVYAPTEAVMGAERKISLEPERD